MIQCSCAVGSCGANGSAVRFIRASRAFEMCIRDRELILQPLLLKLTRVEHVSVLTGRFPPMLR